MIINLTPHPINIVGMVEIVSSGICRVSEQIEVLGSFDGVKIIKKTFGQVENLPDPKKGTIYVVSMVVANALNGSRHDIVIPGEIIRDETGRIIGCKNLAKV